MFYTKGYSPEELVKGFSHLALGQIYDNKELVDKDIRDNSANATPEITGYGKDQLITR
jgi:hypothetical protein